LTEEIEPQEPTGEMTPAEELPALPKEYYGERRRQRAQERRTGGHKRRWVVVLAAIVAGMVLLAGAEAALSYGRIHRGVSVAGIDVGGMRPAQAKASLAAALAQRAKRPVVVKYKESSWEISSEQVGLGFDEDAQVKAAMDVGRDKDFLRAALVRARCWTRGVDVSATPISPSAQMDEVLGKIAEKTDIEPIDASVHLDATSARVVEGKDGVGLDRPVASRRILMAFAGPGSRTVEAPVTVRARKITSDQAGAAASVAEKMLSGPVTVTFEQKKWTFSAVEVSAWLDFRAVEDSGTGKWSLEPFVSPEKASLPITKALGTNVGRPAKNAEFKAADGRVTIVPSQDGVGPDVGDLALTLTVELKDSSADRVVELRTSTTQPAITTEKAQTMGIKERISSYTTTYPSGNRPRVNNIHLLGDALDGTLVAPGGIFSFNGTAGERTAAKGYQEAGAIVNGKLVPQFGGGVCQVGTTIFNAVFESGLPVVERRNHSFFISHYPAGRDATVSWGGPDFKFKNDTPNWILVVVGYTNSSITIALYGTDPGYEVTSERGPWTNIRPYKIEKIDDPLLYMGMSRVEDAGVQGRSCIVKRTVSKDGNVLRTDSFVSNYKPKTEVIRVGTKPPPSKVPTPTP
jgi:vancomycin resistance protein YoaR